MAHLLFEHDLPCRPVMVGWRWGAQENSDDLDDLNAMLLASCRDDASRVIDGREQTVGEALAIERQHLLPLAREGFDLVEVSFGLLNRLGCVMVRTNA